MKIDNRIICAAVGLLALTGCSPLGVYNSVISHDATSQNGPRDVAYGDGPRQKLDVYLPVRSTGSMARKPPLVVFLYGGSWRGGSRQRYSFAGRALAGLGTVTLVPDYRLAPDHVFPAFIEDAAAAIAWAVTNADLYGADPKRVYLVGHSAGAYNAALVALDQSYLKAQGVDPKVISGVVGMSGPYDFDPAEFRVTRAAFAGFLDDPAVLPKTYVSAEAPPMLLLHGEDDRTVGVYNSKSMQTWLSAAGVPVELIVYPDRGHAGTVLALSKPFRSGTPILADIARFMDLNTTPAQAPSGSTGHDERTNPDMQSALLPMR